MNTKILKKITAGALLATVATYASPVLAFTKDETVYAKLDPNGKNYQTLVNCKLQNTEELSLLQDVSNLTNIKNVGGNENFTKKENELVWESNGKDIFYQGESQQELPIECIVTYTLDGKEISAKDLAGKSGKVQIILEYQNKEKHNVTIQGKKETLYTPFVVVCGSVFSNNHSRNIEISNGKVIDDGNKTIVFGVSLPGLQESLAISSNKLEVPNKITITMDATDFELHNFISYVTPKLLENEDLDFLDELDDLYAQVNTLQNASNQIEEGANTLKEGTATYSEQAHLYQASVQPFISGVSSLSEGYTKLDAGISSVNKGAKQLQSGSKALQSGVTSLKDGTNQLQAGSQKLQDGTAKLEMGSKTLSTGMTELEKGTQKLAKGTSDLSSSLYTLAKSVNKTMPKNQKEADAKIAQLQALKDQNQKLMANYSPSDPIYSLLQSNLAVLDENIKTITASVGLSAGINQLNASAKTLADATAELDKKVQKQFVPGVDNLVSSITELNTQVSSTLAPGIQNLASGATQLDHQVSQVLVPGIDALHSGTKALTNGSSQIKPGLNTLGANTEAISQATGLLADGAETISNGANELAEGIQKFNRNGIQKICDYMNNDAKNLTERIQALQNLANDYNNFTMLNKEDTGTVKFILMMDSIKQNRKDTQEAILETPNTKEEKE